MPRAKVNPHTIGIFKLVLLETEAALSRQEIKIPVELKSLVMASCWPNIHPNAKPYLIMHQKTYQEDQRVFGRFCTKNPDQAALILGVIFERLAFYQKPTDTNKVIKLLLNHNTLKKLRRVGGGVDFFKVSQLDINQGSYHFIKDLSDGEIANFLRVETTTVKKARQQLAAKGI